MDPAVLAVVGTLGGALVGGGFALLTDRKRAADADRYRNHDQRADAAVDFLKALDHFRRDVEDGKASAADESGRELADVIGRVALFFDDEVERLAKLAQTKADQARHGDREKLLKKSREARDAARRAMKARLEPPHRRRPVTS